MAPERTAEAVLDLAQRGDHRGADRVMSEARRDVDNNVVPVGIESVRVGGSGRRVLQATLTLIIIAAMGLGMVATGVLPGRSTLSHASHAILGDERSPLERQIDEWLAEHDPAERQHLRDLADPDFGYVSPQYELSTLEFRRTCRKLNSAIRAASGPGVTDRADVVMEMMGPELDRDLERAQATAEADGQPLSYEGSMSSGWRQMTNQVANGDDAPARSFIEHNCGDALNGSWVDR